MKRTALTGLALTIVLATAGAADAATVTLHDAKGPPTAAFTVTGSGFAPGEPVTFTFAPSQPHTVAADGAGTATTTFAAGKATVPGKYPVNATGATSALKAGAVFLVRTNWPQARFGTSRSGVNPYENVLNPANVGSLTGVFDQPCGRGSAWQVPTVASGRAYVGSVDGRLCAFNKASGKALWTVPAGGAVRTPAAAAYTNLYVTAGGTVRALASATGATLWSGRGSRGGDPSAPVAYHHVVYVASSDGDLYAYGADGCGRRTCKPLWRGRVGRELRAAPVAGDGAVLVSATDGTVAKFAAAGCGQAVCRPVALRKAQRNWWGPWRRAVTGALAVSYDKVYVSASDGRIRVLSFADLAPLRETVLPGHPRVSAPAVLKDVLYVVTSDHRLRALDTTTLAQQWSAWLPGGGFGAARLSGPAVANGVVYAADAAGGTSAFATGGPARPWSAPSHWGGAPVVSDGRVYTASGPGVRAFALPF